MKNSYIINQSILDQFKYDNKRHYKKDRCEDCYHQYYTEHAVGVSMCEIPPPSHIPDEQWGKYREERVKNGRCEYYISKTEMYFFFP